MKAKHRISHAFRLFTIGVVSVVIAVILLKPHTSFLLDKDLEPSEITQQVEESDAKESLSEFGPEFTLIRICALIPTTCHAPSDILQMETPVSLLYYDIFLPPPEC
jgi:hypothetical protein